jgi:hypothetical protein
MELLETMENLVLRVACGNETEEDEERKGGKSSLNH